MKTKQFIYPFSNGGTINTDFLRGFKCIQIGVECPQSTPISEREDSEIVLNINGRNFSISDRDILEFENLDISQLSIRVVKTNYPYLIIDIAYE